MSGYRGTGGNRSATPRSRELFNRLQHLDDVRTSLDVAMQRVMTHREERVATTPALAISRYANSPLRPSSVDEWVRTLQVTRAAEAGFEAGFEAAVGTPLRARGATAAPSFPSAVSRFCSPVAKVALVTSSEKMNVLHNEWNLNGELEDAAAMDLPPQIHAGRGIVLKEDVEEVKRGETRTTTLESTRGEDAATNAVERQRRPSARSNNGDASDGGEGAEDDALRVALVALAKQNESLQAELNETRTKLALAEGFRSTNDDLRQRLESAQTRALETETKLRDAESTFATTLGEHDSKLRAQAKQYEQRLDAAETSLEALRGDAARLEAAAAQRDADEKSREEEYSARKKRYEEKAHEEEMKRKAAQQVAEDALKQQVREAVDVAAVYRKELDNLQTILQKAENEKLALKAQLEAEALFSSTQAKNDAAAEEECDALRREVAAMSTTMESLTNVLKEKENDIEMLTAELEHAIGVGNVSAKQKVEDRALKLISVDAMKWNRDVKVISRERDVAQDEAAALRAELDETRAAHAMAEEYERIAVQSQQEAVEAADRAAARTAEAKRLRARNKELEELLFVRNGELDILTSVQQQQQQQQQKQLQRLAAVVTTN